jgi:hypothetical protein
VIALALLSVAAHLAIAVVELPGLWGKRTMRGEFWTVIVLLLLGAVAAFLICLQYRPISPWKVIEALFKPIGTILFKPKGG